MSYERWAMGNVLIAQGSRPIAAQISKKMKLFGTSGIRGVFGKELTLDLSLKIGKAIGTYIDKAEAVIARDTRTSSMAVENAVISGLESSGISVLRAGMVPTPTLAFAARKLNSAGIMITASQRGKSLEHRRKRTHFWAGKCA